MLARNPGVLRTGAMFKEWALPGALGMSKAACTRRRTVIARWPPSSPLPRCPPLLLRTPYSRVMSRWPTAPAITPAGVILMEQHQVLEVVSELKLIGMQATCDEMLSDALKRQHLAQQLVSNLLQAVISKKLATILNACSREMVGHAIWRTTDINRV
jgi:hypothetical protein